MPSPMPERRSSETLPMPLAAGYREEEAPVAPATQGPDLVLLLRGLGRRWLLFVFLGTLCAAGAAAAAWFLLTPKTTAFAQLHVAASAPRMVFKTADAVENGRNDFSTYMKTQAARLKGRFVLNAALKAEGIKRLPLVAAQADPVAWLDEELKVEFENNSEILTVSLAGHDAPSLIAIVNAVAQAYLQEIENQERKSRSRRVAELDNIYVAAKEKLRVKRETLRRRADELGTSDSAAMTQRQLIQLGNLGEIKKQHAQVRFELLQTQARMAAHEQRIKNPPSAAVSDSAIEERLTTDELARVHRARVTKLQAVIQDYELHAQNPNENTLVRARAHRDAALKEIDKRRAAIVDILAAELQRKNQIDLKSGVESFKDAVVMLEQQEKTLRDEMERLNRDAEKIGRTSTEVELLGSEIKQEERLSQQVADELEALQVELRSPNRVNLAQEAALQPVTMKKQVGATIAAGLAGFFGVGMVIGWWEFLRRRVHTPDEVSRGLGLRVIGAVPSLARGNSEDAEPHIRESIHGIRARLLRETRLADIRTIMITSADSGEGKTTLAGQIATSFAQAGQRTLLVDGNLRAPKLHQLFETTVQPGLSEVLLGELPLDNALRTTSIDGLSFLPAGEWDSNVLKALAGNGLSQMIKHLKEQFDLILIDSHPVLETSDSLLMGQHVDAALLSLLRGVSEVPRVQAAMQQLANMGIPVLGAVVNGVHSVAANVRARNKMANKTTMVGSGGDRLVA